MSDRKLMPVELKAGDVIADAFGNEKVFKSCSLRGGKAVLQFMDGSSRTTGILAGFRVLRNTMEDKPTGEDKP